MALTRVDFKKTIGNTGNSQSTGTFTWNSGDLFVVIGGNDAGTNALTTPTVGGVAMTPLTVFGNDASHSYGRAYWYITPSASSGVITGDNAGVASDHFQLLCWQFRDHNGLGDDSGLASTALTVSNANTGSNSWVVAAWFDFNAGAAGRTGTPTVTNEVEDMTTGNYSVWGGDWSGQTGTVAYGTTTSGGGQLTKIAVEVLEFVAGAPKIEFDYDLRIDDTIVDDIAIAWDDLDYPISTAEDTTPTDSDTAVAVDAGESISVAITDAETAVGADTHTVLTSSLTDVESATSAEVETISSAFTTTETAVGVDTESSISTALIDIESGVGVDVELISAGLTDLDTGAAVDAGVVGVPITSADTAIGAEGGAGWDPTMLSTLVAAWDFSNTALITASGGLVSQVDGAYGTTYAATQGTGANQPSTGVSTINGLNVLTSHFRSWLNVTGAPAQNQPLTYVVVAKNTTTGAWQYMVGATGGANYLYMSQGSSQVGVYAGTSQNITPQDRNLHVDIVGMNGASSTFYRDGDSKTFGGSPGTGVLSAGSLKISSSGDAGFIGDICEVWLIDGELSTEEREAAESYLKTKWGWEWTPLYLPSLVTWHDASDTSTITASGGAVSQWNDKSGNSRYMFQSTGSNQPLTGVNTVNGRNVLTFDGSNDRMTSIGFSVGTTNLSVYRVFVLTDAGDHGAGHLGGWSGHSPYGGNNQTFRVYQPAGGGSATDAGPSLVSAPSATDVLMWRAIVDSSGCHQAIVGSGENVTTDTAYTASAVTLSSIGVGTDTGSRFQSGYQCEVVLCSTNLTGTDKSNLEDYLITKWTGTAPVPPSGAGSPESIAASLTDAETAVGVDINLTLAAALTDLETAVAVDTESLDMGSTTENKNDSETGTGAETESISAALADPDVGTSLDAESIATTLTDPDTGAATDAGLIATALTDAEAASGVDAELVSPAITDPDTGVVTDAAGSIAAALTDVESAGGADIETSIAAALTDADTGTAVDDGTIGGTSTPTDSDTGVAVDDGSIASTLSDPDTGTSAEAETLAVSLSTTETGIAADAGEAIAAGLSDADLASSSDSESLAAPGTPSDFDLGAATDTEAVAATLSDIETASGVDTELNVGSPLSDSDAGSGADASVSVALNAADTAIVVDAEATFTAMLDSSDSAIVIELESIAAGMNAVDTAIADDAVGFVAQLKQDTDFFVIVETEFVNRLTVTELALILGRILPGWRLYGVGQGWQLKEVLRGYLVNPLAPGMQITEIQDSTEMD